MTKEAFQLSTDDLSLHLRELSSELDDVALHEAVTEYPEYSDNFSNSMIEHLGTLEKVREKRLKSTDAIRMGIWKDDEFVGLISADTGNEDASKAEIGYFIRKGFSGNGYATLALKALIPYATSRFSRLHAAVDVRHTASARVLEKAGYAYVGTQQRSWSTAKVFEPPHN